jgi:hypothetical protein
MWPRIHCALSPNLGRVIRSWGHRTMERNKSDADLHVELEDQLAFLRKSAQAYDDGELREAKRLATNLYILLHEGPQNKSLLRKLRIRSRLPLVSTALKIKQDGHGEVFGFAPPLTCLLMGEREATFVPHCKLSTELPPWSRAVGFKDWWDESISQIGNRELSRKGLVFLVRSQDGGSHVDHKRKGESYIEFIEAPASPGVSFNLADGSSAPSNPHLASIRQIAWELDHALKQLLG